MNKIRNIAVIGLGYVGLPLAAALGKKYNVLGYDLSQERINQLNDSYDLTNELSKDELKEIPFLDYSSDEKDLVNKDFYIITVPTPILDSKEPDLRPIISATKTVAKYIKKESIIVYESTVFPGCTEEVCVPIIEELSGLKFNKDFFCGYSPERINPGDKLHRIENITKVTSGSTEESAQVIDSIYESIIEAGTHLAESIKVAEAAKVIENTQRDLNIAFMNELAKIFDNLDIDTTEVLKAASTKWNFLNFVPGLVGGHCIGVDPYYLTYQSKKMGYNPEFILAGRSINESMTEYVCSRLLKEMENNHIKINQSKVLILGFTFKENCPDVRNSKIKDLYNFLIKKVNEVVIYDPWVNEKEHKNFKFIDINEITKVDAIIGCTPHEVFKNIGTEHFKKILNENSVVYDLKNSMPNEIVDIKL